MDGEAVRLNPCTIELSHLNKARILAKKKSGRKLCNTESDEVMTSLTVMVTTIKNYEECSGVKEQLLNKCINIGSINIGKPETVGHIGRQPALSLEEENDIIDWSIEMGK